MKYKSTLVLLALVVIAGVVAHVLSKKPTSEELEQQQGRVLPGLTAKDVAAIEIETAKGKVVCERTGKEKWLITEPLKLRADQYEVEGILNAFVNAERVGRLTLAKPGEKLDLAQYGLDKPARKVTFRGAGKGAQARSVAFGNDVGVGDLVSATTERRDAVMRVKSDVAKKLDTSINDLRSKKLADEMDADKLTACRIETAQWGEKKEFKATCERKDKTWELSEPIRDLVNSEAIKELVRKINYHEVSPSDFVLDDPTKAGEYGLTSPALTVALKFGDEERTFIFGCVKDKEDDKFYAMNKAEPAIVKVPKTLFEDLRVEPDSLREKTLVAFDKEKVAKVVISGVDASLALEKKDKGWQMAGEPPGRADDQAVGEMLSGLESARVKDFAAYQPEKPETYGLDDKQVRKVELKGKDDKVIAQVEIGALNKDAGVVYARRTGYQAVLSLAKEAYLIDVRRGRLSFLPRVVLEEPTDRAVEVALAYDGQSFKCTREGPDAEWKLAEPVQGRADGQEVSRITRLFAGMRVKGFAAESAEDLKPYGLDSSRVHVTVVYLEAQAKAGKDEGKGETPPATRARQLLVGAESKEYLEGFFAKLDGDKRVFVLSGPDVDGLRVNPASKVICKSKDIEKLTFTWPGGSLAVVRKDGDWKAADGAGLDEAVRQKVKDVVWLLGEFDAADIAALIEKDPAAYGFDKPSLVVEFKDATAEGKKVVIGSATAEGARYTKGTESSFVLIARKGDADRLLAVTKPPEKPEQKPATEKPEAQPAPGAAAPK